MADVDALGFAQLMTSPQVNDPEYYTKQILANRATGMANQDVMSRQRAGQLFAAGDYAGAAAALAPADLKSAIGLQDRTSLQGAAAAANRGDPNAAGAAAAQTGDIKSVADNRGQAGQIAGQQFAGLQLFARQLASIPEAPGDAQNDPTTPRAQAARQLAQSGIYNQYGLTPDLLAKGFGGSPGDLADGHLNLVLGAQLPFSGTLKEGDVAYVNGQPVARGGDKPVVAGPDQRVVSNTGSVLSGAQPLPVKVAPGEGLRDPLTGAPVGDTQPFQAKPFDAPAGNTIGYVGGDNSVNLPGQSPAMSPSPASAATSPASGNGGHNGPGGGAGADQVWANIVQRESGGRAGATGPQTPYGVAHGSTQMLDGTAREMATKLGLPWRPDLMRGTTPEAAQYQQTLGRAYFDEGLAKGNGDPAFAAAYYQGGPNTAIHGPQNAAYVHAVTGTAKGSTDAPLPSAPGTRAGVGVRPAEQYGLRGQRSPDGSFQPTPGANYDITTAMGARRELLNSDTYKLADNATTAANTLHAILNAARDNSGLVSMAALDNTIRAQTGLSAKANQVDLMMTHLGVPNELRGKVGEVLGRGFLVPGVVQEAEGILDNYAKVHNAAVQRRIIQEQSFAKASGYGGDLGLQVPQLTSPSTAKWLPGAAQSNQVTSQSGGAPRANDPPVRLQGGGPAARAQYAALPSGARYIAPDGSTRTKR